MNKVVMLSLLAAVMLTGCVSSEVRSFADNSEWAEMGNWDASHGYQKRSVEELEKLGAKDKVAQSDYMDAYKKGIDVYCNPMNGYAVGIKGLPYTGVCSDRKDGWIFYENYQSGLESGSVF